MYKVTRLIHFCYGHRLLNYSGKCRYLHGHNGQVEIELSTEGLNELGMARDFGDIKEVAQKWIDDNLDHAMLLNKEDPLLPTLRESGDKLFVMDGNPTAEAIAKCIFDHCAKNNLPVTEVRLWETPNSVASYRP